MIQPMRLSGALCILLAVQALYAEDWPMWRGPRGDGVSEDAPPLHWSNTENVAWKTKIPGVGYSSPIVWKNSVFLTSADLETKERLLFCLDRRTGAVRWQTTVAVAEIEQMHRLNSPASGTPATDGERVFVLFQTGEELLAAAYDFSGNLLWRRSPGKFRSRHGFNTSPVLFEDSILVSGMQDGEDAFLARLQRQTGELVWKAPISNGIRSFSTPLVIDVQDRQQIILSGANRTMAFDPQDGRQIWHVQGPAEKTVSSLSYDDQRVFVSGGRDKMLYAIRPTGAGDVTQSHIQWKATRSIPYVNSPLLYGGFLHVLSDDGIYSCLNPSDGNMLCRHRATGKASSSPVGAKGRVYLTNEEGVTTVIASGPDYHVLVENDLGEPVHASIAIADSDLLIRGVNHLYLISAAR